MIINDDDHREGLRRPIQTPYMRRDSVYNPEFLDTQRLLDRFAPLIESVIRQLRPWYIKYSSKQDAEDLRSIVQLEFLQLHENYNPSYGVDFPGYIKMYLRGRVNYCVARHSKRTSREVLGFSSGGTDRSIAEMIPDEKAAGALESVDRSASVPLGLIDNEMYRDIIRMVLEEGADTHTLAKKYNMSPRAMAQTIEAAGDYARQIMARQEEETAMFRSTDEEDADGEKETEQ